MSWNNTVCLTNVTKTFVAYTWVFTQKTHGVVKRTGCSLFLSFPTQCGVCVCLRVCVWLYSLEESSYSVVLSCMLSSCCCTDAWCIVTVLWPYASWSIALVGSFFFFHLSHLSVSCACVDSFDVFLLNSSWVWTLYLFLLPCFITKKAACIYLFFFFPFGN